MSHNIWEIYLKVQLAFQQSFIDANLYSTETQSFAAPGVGIQMDWDSFQNH